ncbi:hypothetical protein A5731_02220 [Mycolicibacterium conceptionense]|uniref:Transmembrane protein n=1 Tax=Mycolicibacterium conceptionense TaxID=451644 RepID=A0A1A0PJQ1_9MYCO|nr:MULTISPECIES: hypothetical protein [Mycolicibacterium]MCW1821686.1 hypothetical protein [Mycolicibacterium senegalense]OBB10166.1 hypothetical protein A5718_09740 [Mycolicibacterium conceptionense]OBF08881.1 hypothetical protein A5731_02220 [Mycolicibacterium conceptionense]OBF25773.1 hypothetical protein A5726_07125 [Mycolicibacterium conceptionense]OBF43456.1 hypothetical protein A5720_12580 [Mycolicibacterium conceptionense]
MDVDGDLLTAAGLLLATLGLLFAAWHPEIAAATEVSSRGKLADRGPRIAQVKQALVFRAAPLLIAIVFVVLACGPPAVMVVVHALGDHRGNPYDPVRALFVGVWSLTIGMGFAVAAQVRTLYAKWRRLNEPD